MNQYVNPRLNQNVNDDTYAVAGAGLSPWFLALSGAMGAGLLYAGLTNTCGLATLLARMPWNRSA